MLAACSEASDGESSPQGGARRLGGVHDSQDNPKMLGPLHNRQGEGYAQTFSQVRSFPSINILFRILGYLVFFRLCCQ